MVGCGCLLPGEASACLYISKDKMRHIGRPVQEALQRRIYLLYVHSELQPLTVMCAGLNDPTGASHIRTITCFNPSEAHCVQPRSLTPHAIGSQVICYLYDEYLIQNIWHRRMAGLAREHSSNKGNMCSARLINR